MTSRRSRLLLLVLAVAIAASFGGSTSATARSTAPTKVRIALGFQWQPQFAPLLYGISKGIFKKQNLNLDVQPTFGAVQALQLQAAGKTDFVLSDLGTYITARANGQTKTKIVYVYEPSPTLGLVSLKPYPTPQTLAGKTFATLATSAGAEIIQYLMKENGVDPNSLNVKKLDFSVLYASLFQGTIDAAEVRDPGSWRTLQSTAAKQNRQVFLTRMADWGLNSYGYVLTAPESMIKKNPDLVRRVVAAVAQSEHDARNKMTGAQAAQLVATKTQVSDPAAAALDWQDFRTYSKGDGAADVFIIGQEIGLQLRTGVIKNRIRPASTFTNRFVPKAT